MMLPGWVAVALAVVILLVAAGSAVRLAIWRLRGRAAEPEADALHVVMGVAMAGMFEPRIRLIPNTAWLAVFAAAAAWFAVRAIRARGRDHQAKGWQLRPGGWRCVHPGPHCVECAAMVYMLLPAVGDHAPAIAMAGGAPTANPAVALVLALFLLGYVMWTADRLTRQSRPYAVAPARGAAPDRPEPAGAVGRARDAALAPRAAECSKIAMSLAMGCMLLMML